LVRPSEPLFTRSSRVAEWPDDCCYNLRPPGAATIPRTGGYVVEIAQGAKDPIRDLPVRRRRPSARENLEEELGVAVAVHVRGSSDLTASDLTDLE
jgi:hypothetical protein